jgi:G3E family GTPase
MIKIDLIHGISQTLLETVKQGLQGSEEIIIYYERSFNETGLLDFQIIEKGEVRNGSIGRLEECISCKCRSHTYDLVQELQAKYEDVNVVVIVPAFVEPRAVADYIIMMDGDLPENFLDIRSVSSVIDCMSFFQDVAVIKIGQEITKSEFLYRSIEYSDSLFLGNSHRISKVKLEELKEISKQVNSKIKFCELSNTGILLTALSELHIFDYEDPTRFSPLTSESLITYSNGVEVERVVWSSDTPLHSERFADFIENNLENIFRSRGNLWFANCIQNQVGWESTSNIYCMDRLDTWDEIGIGAENFLVILVNKSSISSSAVKAALDNCVLTSVELETDISTWKQMKDPLYEATRECQE